MKVNEVTGWKQGELDLTSLDENGVDEDVLLSVIKDNDLVLTFFGRELESTLTKVAEVLHNRVSKQIWDDDQAYLHSNTKKLLDFYYDPKNKWLIGQAVMFADISFPGSSSIPFKYWFTITKQKVSLMREKYKPMPSELSGMINLRFFTAPEAWAHT